MIPRWREGAKVPRRRKGAPRHPSAAMTRRKREGELDGGREKEGEGDDGIGERRGDSEGGGDVGRR